MSHGSLRTLAVITLFIAGCGAGAIDASQCTNGKKDGTEADVDCGGGCPNACLVGQACRAFSDCASGLCNRGVCEGSGGNDGGTTASCTDGIRNGDESDVDCGGACPTRCANGRACKVGGDCAVSSCVQGVCAPQSCANGTRDNGESDVDCGGLCAGCAGGKSCLAPTDCASLACESGTCTQVSLGSTRPCAISNGAGTQTYDGATWSSCVVASCDAGYHIEAGSCQSNSRTCTSGGAPGTETWNGTGYGPCVATGCPQAQHMEGGVCLPNVRGCTVANGSGSQTWNGTGYGTCTAVSCAVTFHLESGACASDTKACAVVNGTGSQTWNGSAWGACTATSCNQGFQLVSGSCLAPPVIIFSDTRDGASKLSFKTSQTFYGRLLNLKATGAQACIEIVGSTDGACATGPWTTLPNAEWSYEAATMLWRGVIGANLFPAGKYKMFARDQGSGLSAQPVILTLTAPVCYWNAIVPGPVTPPATPCTTSNVGAMEQASGYTWTCECQ